MSALGTFRCLNGAHASSIMSLTCFSSTPWTHASCCAPPPARPFTPRRAPATSPGFQSGPSPPSSADSFARSLRESWTYLNGRGVSSGIGVVRQNGAPSGLSGSFRTSKSKICFFFASPSMRLVTTELPGCEMLKLPVQSSVGSTRHSCSCPQTTKSSQDGRYRSDIAFFGE
eukprot:31197-Pelagococcus_subviridis.AAC.1